MPNKVLGYYTTDQAYRPTASNHIYNVDYDEDSLSLWVSFHNGARYLYMGVPKHLYEGMMASPSHGTFFWANIRQRFPYKLIEKGSSVTPKPKTKDILAELSKGYKKLSYYDEIEKELEDQLKKGEVDEEKYYLTLELLLSLREKASDTVDREMGIYKTPAQKRKEVREALKLVEEIQNRAAEERAYKVYQIKKALMWAVIVAGVVLTCYHPILGFLVGSVIYKLYWRVLG